MIILFYFSMRQSWEICSSEISKLVALGSSVLVSVILVWSDFFHTLEKTTQYQVDLQQDCTIPYASQQLTSDGQEIILELLCLVIVY